MPRNRSEKAPRLNWEEPDAVRAWTAAVKHGESVGLTGPWFPEVDLDMDDAQAAADTKISRLFFMCHESDRILIFSLAPQYDASNDQQIAQANIILRSMGHATQPK